MTENLAAAERSSPAPICILICQHLTCRKQGAAKVLTAAKDTATSGIKYEGCGCLGRCGNGPNLIVLPARIWYHRVRPQDIPKIVAACKSQTDDRSVDAQQP
jgi:(2Fe-2S) ferredoxin